MALLRSLVFVILAVTAALALISRIAVASSTARSAQAERLPLRPGDRIGGAVYEGLVDHGARAARLRVERCDGPIFAMAMPLTTVAMESVIEQGYGKSGYHSTNLYRGEIRDTFSRFERLTARNPFVPYSAENGFFVRFFAPADCIVDKASALEWAKAAPSIFVTDPADGAAR